MIYIDSSELKSNSLTAKNLSGNYIPVDGLEAMSGGDCLVSIAELPNPINLQILKLHIQRGAIVVQIKHGHDLSSSVGVRMNESLYRMQKVGCKPWQSVLLFCGFLTLDFDGYAKINTQLSYHQNQKMKWIQVQAAINLWRFRGGCYDNVYSSRLLQDWLELQVSHLKKCTDEPVKQFWPDKPVMHSDNFDPLQELEKVTDFRVTLMTCPGLGTIRINNFYDWMIENEYDLTLRQSLVLLVTEHERIVKEVKLWGVKTIQSVWIWYDGEREKGK